MAFSRFRNRDHRVDLTAVDRAVAELKLPEAIYRTCPWQPRDLVEAGLRQWLRCCGAAMRDGQVIGMPSHAVDEAWHGLILCTELYAAFCTAAYGRFLHHYPDGVGSSPRGMVGGGADGVGKHRGMVGGGADGVGKHRGMAGGGADGVGKHSPHGSMSEQLGRTVVAWSLIAAPGETCVLWDLDRAVGVDHPWGINARRVAAIEAELSSLG